MPRFHCPGPLQIGALHDLPAALAHHVQVLRLSSGDAVTLFDGGGGEYGATIADIGRKSASVRIDAHLAREVELPYRIAVAQALPEGAKMDWIVEKAVELGAVGLTPLAAQRCVVKLSGERAEKRRQHWQAIAVSASEQCGRNRIMQVDSITEFGRFLADPPTQPAAARPQPILLTPDADTHLADWARDAGPQPVCFLIGPEGGFTAAEVALARKHGALAVRIGARVLRTETAALAAVAMLVGIWGEAPAALPASGAATPVLAFSGEPAAKASIIDGFATDTLPAPE